MNLGKSITLQKLPVELDGLKMHNSNLMCPECLKKGVKSAIELFQINFDEAIFLCPSGTCSFPFKENYAVEKLLLQHDASTLCTEVQEDFDINSLPDYSHFLPNLPIHKSNVLHYTSHGSFNFDASPNFSQSQDSVGDDHSAIINVKQDDAFSQITESAESIHECDDIPDGEISEYFSTETVSARTVKLGQPPVNKKMIQWVNEANSCWLDAIMGTLVRSCNVRSVLNLTAVAETNILRRIFSSYDDCQQLYQQNCDDSASEKILTKVCDRLGRVRNSLLEELQKLSPIQLGEFQSLLEMLPLVLKTCSATEDFFKVNTLWSFECENCGHKRAHRSSQSIVSFPSVCADFHPLNARFQRCCYECSDPKGNMTMLMERIPPCIAFHFQKGLPYANLRVLDFAVQGHLYSILAVVQYVVTPIKHFITWVRDVKTDRWLCCDDLKSPICSWQSRLPKLPPSKIHMVFWERNATSDPSKAQDDDVKIVLNEEAIEFADEIPLEHFFLYEDETIIVPEEDETLEEQVQNSAMHHEKFSIVKKVNMVSQSTPLNKTIADSKNPSGEHSLLADIDNTSLVSETFHFDQSMFVNGGLSINPEVSGKHTIQLVAPSNTCSIYIITNDSRTPSLLYQGMSDHGRSLHASKSPARSFVDDSHSYNMVTQGYLSSHKRKVKKKFSYPEKRQFRLSGYSTVGSSLQFSPIRESSHKKLKAEVSSLPRKPSSKKKSDSAMLSKEDDVVNFQPEFKTQDHLKGESNLSTSNDGVNNATHAL